MSVAAPTKPHSPELVAWELKDAERLLIEQGRRERATDIARAHTYHLYGTALSAQTVHHAPTIHAPPW